LALTDWTKNTAACNRDVVAAVMSQKDRTQQKLALTFNIEIHLPDANRLRPKIHQQEDLPAT
jgi:hypothetical protein